MAVGQETFDRCAVGQQRAVGSAQCGQGSYRVGGHWGFGLFVFDRA
ncbi:hypothetical protein GLE_4265 [Lysobacter enzymogenes]|uniref:Uncharacterized protein n=1 Tax=Lysobacter enzymogenes TaxID=69 RepID=A0A0S2DLS3_LYSEN|nr:hypothetical protein GLE_4265 [Lysobacter enzymogenes]